jgi:hypothetical protein
VINIDTKEFPEAFFRGISSPSDITNEGYVAAGAFQFDAFDPQRGDDYCELSINWDDDEGSLKTLLEQHKPKREDKQFKGGYCTINRAYLNGVFKLYMDNGTFSYERRPIDACEENDYQTNPYHGNLLMKNSIDKQMKKNMQHTLAFVAGEATRRE